MTEILFLFIVLYIVLMLYRYWRFKYEVKNLKSSNKIIYEIKSKASQGEQQLYKISLVIMYFAITLSLIIAFIQLINRSLEYSDIAPLLLMLMLNLISINTMYSTYIYQDGIINYLFKIEWDKIKEYSLEKKYLQIHNLYIGSGIFKKRIVVKNQNVDELRKILESHIK